MPKMMLHDDAAREALGRGVAKLARAVGGTLGPRGMNAVMDRPIGSPIVSRDGVSIADEIELECPFENMGAQIVREVARQTNEVAGDGTTTRRCWPMRWCRTGSQCLPRAPTRSNWSRHGTGGHRGDRGAQEIARPLQGVPASRAVASIAANDAKLGDMVAEAFERAGRQGIVDVQYGIGVETVLEVVEGMTFDRGYLSHHMVTDVEKMQVVLDNPLHPA